MSHPAALLAPMGLETWNPWVALRSREHITFGMADLPDATGGGVHLAYPDGTAVILLDRRLTQVERNAVMTHELVHDERGTTHHGNRSDIWRPKRVADERAVERETARRLVPLRLLQEFADRLATVGEGVEPWMVMEEFSVPWDVAATALDLLCEWERR